MNERKRDLKRAHQRPGRRDTPWDYTAQSQDELLDIGSRLFRGPDQNRLDEQVQITHLLGAFARTAFARFPVRVSHVPDSVPDFQLQVGGRRIGVEVTKIAVPDVEHARSLQNRGLKRTLGISSLLRRNAKRRSKAEVVAEGFGMQQFVFSVSPQEHREIWIGETAARLDDKSRVLRSAQFQHGQEDWLLLWDRIGTADWEVQARIQTFGEPLSARWNRDWYSRVILQAGHFEWHFAFDATGPVRLPQWRH